MDPGQGFQVLRALETVVDVYVASALKNCRGRLGSGSAPPGSEAGNSGNSTRRSSASSKAPGSERPPRLSEMTQSSPILKIPIPLRRLAPQRAQPAPQAPHSPSLPPMSESDDTSSVAEAQAESQMASPESGFRDSGISLRCDAEHNCTASAGGCLCQLRNDSTDKVHEDIEDFYIQDFAHQPDISQQYPGWINPEFWNLPQSNIDGSLASEMVADCDPMNEDYDGYASGQNHG